ncbi:MAG TPA: hypothetical protein VJ803_02855 [Gemmatimonadaceae bacterium]|nr:hypothetical protein [Gemmatimonadaceae bacterium]
MLAALIQDVAAAAVIALAAFGLAPAAASGGVDPTSIPVESTALPPDLCSLLTEQEAETILGMPLEPPQQQRSGDCWYLRQGGTDFGAVELFISVLPVRMTSRKHFDSFVAEQVTKMNDRLEKAGAKGEPFTAEPVPELKDPAYYVDPGLYVLKGDQVLVLGIDRPRALLVAAKAVPRFQP